MSKTTFLSENQFRKKLIREMELAGAHAIPIETHGSKVGVADINYAWMGQEYWIELKVGYNFPSGPQKKFMATRWSHTKRTYYLVLEKGIMTAYTGHAWKRLDVYESEWADFNAIALMNRLKSHSEWETARLSL